MNEAWKTTLSWDRYSIYNKISLIHFQPKLNKEKCVDPAFRLMRFPLEGELDFNLKIWFLFIKRMTWSHHLFLFYF